MKTRPLPLLLLVLVQLPAWAAPPNVVLIMADDLGYHDLSCYGHAKIKSPALDRLATEGVRLTSFYAGATVCTPSRMALLTGSYPSRLGWEQGVVGYLMKRGTGLDPAVRTLGEIFSGQGYQTALIGKWHLGDAKAFLPHRQGFHHSYYIKRSNNQTDELWREDELLEKPFTNRQLSAQFAQEAVRFIEASQQQEKPFLLYIPFTAPHFPLEAHPDWKGRSEFGVFGDVVEEMDHRIGEILAALAEHDLERDTLVVFLSDNGPEPGTKVSRATPWRGRKWDALEGGTRVPCIWRWPGKLPAGTVCDEMIAAIDILPTLCHVCGIDLGNLPPPKPAMDGVNVWATLTGKTAEHPRKDLLYWHGRHGFQAIRVGHWKLFLQRKDAKLDGGSGPALFDLSQNPEERIDVSDQFPRRVQAMQALAAERLASIARDRIGLAVAP